ncbi:hypothetical protein CCMA1212_009500, partial [Trichoderma ghanense]
LGHHPQQEFSATIAVESRPSSSLRRPRWPAARQRLPASPPLATLEKRRGSLRRCLELAGVEGGGETSAAGHWLEASPGALGDAGSRVNAAPRSWKLRVALAWGRRRWADDGSCWSTVHGLHLSWNPSDVTNARHRDSRPPPDQPGTVLDDDLMRGNTLLHRHALICWR